MLTNMGTVQKQADLYAKLLTIVHINYIYYIHSCFLLINFYITQLASLLLQDIYF